MVDAWIAQVGEPMLIRFKRDHTVNARGGATYSVGEIVQVNEASARHFVRRGLAEIVDDTTVVTSGTVETAAVEAPEKAVRGRGRPRKLSSDED